MSEDIDRLLARMDAVAKEHGDFMVIEVETAKGVPINDGEFTIARIKRDGDGDGVVLQFGERMYLCHIGELRKALDEN